MTEYIELNMSNYDREDVAQLNDWAIEACEVIYELKSEIMSLRSSLRRVERTRDMYAWCLEHNIAALRNDLTGEWWSYDTDGDRIESGKDMEEALWGAFDLDRYGEQ
jgi:hypothetical protein